MRASLFLLVALFGLCLCTRSVEARGGRGRGSFGGFLSSWRRTKLKSTNSRNPLRTTQNHMPVNNPYMPQAQSVPMQQQKMMQKNFGHFQNTNTHWTGTHLANHPAATHYTNTANLPMGAVYVPYTPNYAQASSSSGMHDFLMGYMTGRILSHATYPQYHHVHHYYAKNTGQQVVVIENGNLSKTTTQENLWPTDALVPLSPFNSSLTSIEDQTPTQDPIFKYVAMPKTDVATTETPKNATLNATQETPPGGIICMPMMFNETDANDSEKIIQVEKLVCFPAPPPAPTGVSTDANGPDCVIRNFIETDPNNPAENINVPRWHCSPATTERSEPVVGDILALSDDSALSL